MQPPFHRTHSNMPIPYYAIYQPPNHNAVPPVNAVPSSNIAVSAQLKQKTRTYRRRCFDEEKLESILAVIRDAKWSLGKFLYKLFLEPAKQLTTDQQEPQMARQKARASRSDSHRHFVAKFLSGSSQHKPCEIVELMYWSKATRCHERLFGTRES